MIIHRVLLYCVVITVPSVVDSLKLCYNIYKDMQRDMTIVKGQLAQMVRAHGSHP